MPGTRGSQTGAVVSRVQVTDDFEKLHSHLHERVKELQCLYGIAQLVELHGNDLNLLVQGVANLIPPSWQYPEITCARIVLNDQQYTTAGFRKTRWTQSANIVVSGRKAGLVEVCYLKKMPNSDEGPFLKEERALIDAIAERLGRVVERVNATDDLERLHHHLHERVKELQCLYGIAQLVEQHGDDTDLLIQGVTDLIPPSWQYPEISCARIILNDRQYESEGFRTTRWRQYANIVVDGQKAGSVEVCYFEKMPDSDEGPFLKEERALIDAIAERIGRVVERTVAVGRARYAHEELKVERTTLQETNTALRVLLARIEDEKREIRDTILANVDKILLPILHTLEIEAPPGQEAYVQLLRQSLTEIASPLISDLSRKHLDLTPIEFQICNMIRNGLTTKEIARLRHVATATVRGQRESIRRKLGIVNREVNLVTYLQSYEHQPSPGVGARGARIPT